MPELSIGDAMKNFLQKSRLKNGVRTAQLEEVWKEMMGEVIAKYTDKLQILNQKLFIKTNNGALKNELLFQKLQIISLINEKMGEGTITEVIVS
ncbi:MAG TPA: DUF721 domain-containing protein [Arachidicoccus soli]|jgi:predicted nucleic acid-binding Zn ribbon protein|uniref:DUF721 domain-containing protein n=1 Tax=Arachidicoccus soli TaxID=2341117 RepID=A0A386HQ53_9BACT|nr:DUF721 domain-containing protein [Arachidicoccus soli]AYD48077.1 DUF721 domain-containing protein [Arachidicoccus soli]HEU0227092.1 DUF721 domain-containing protein [Arachidicoccus soli]